jgi:hypothetical protein
VGVDLEQDGDAVPGAAGDLGGGSPELSHSGDRRVLQLIRDAGPGEERHCASVSADLRASAHTALQTES